MHFRETFFFGTLAIFIIVAMNLFAIHKDRSMFDCYYENNKIDNYHYF